MARPGVVARSSVSSEARIGPRVSTCSHCRNVTPGTTGQVMSLVMTGGGRRPCGTYGAIWPAYAVRGLRPSLRHPLVALRPRARVRVGRPERDAGSDGTERERGQGHQAARHAVEVRRPGSPGPWLPHRQDVSCARRSLQTRQPRPAGRAQGTLEARRTTGSSTHVTSRARPSRSSASAGSHADASTEEVLLDMLDVLHVARGSLRVAATSGAAHGRSTSAVQPKATSPSRRRRSESSRRGSEARVAAVTESRSRRAVVPGTASASTATAASSDVAVDATRTRACSTRTRGGDRCAARPLESRCPLDADSGPATHLAAAATSDMDSSSAS